MTDRVICNAVLKAFLQSTGVVCVKSKRKIREDCHQSNMTFVTGFDWLKVKKPTAKPHVGFF